MRCRYNAVNFLPNPHNRHPIACLWGRDMGCPLWMITLIYVLLQSLTVVMCATSCYIGLRYNGTWRYHSWRYHSWYNLHNVTPCLANSHTSIAINTLRRRYYVVIYFEYIFLKKKIDIYIEILLKFVPRSPTSNKPALVQTKAWRWTGKRSLFEPMMTKFIDAFMRHLASISRG